MKGAASGVFGRVALVACVALCACGREDIALPSPPTGVLDATAPVFEAGVRDDAGGEDDDATCSSAPAPSVCLGNGVTCGAGTDCCSGRCSGSVCLAAGACSGAGADCTTRSDCCSGRCEPAVGSVSSKCTPYCAVDGAPCTRAVDCCSLGCNAGTCGSALCATAGTPCEADGDCCSGECPTALGVCSLTPTLCRGTGEVCSGGEVPPCCFGCDTQSDRCEFGAGPCLPRGAPCDSATAGETCCEGTCAATDGGVAVCTSACVEGGSACATSDECCTGECAGSPLRCELPAAACAIVGATCSVGTDCCTGACVKGHCGCAAATP